MIRQAALLLCIWPLAASGQAVEEPDSYKMDHYRGPVPDTLAGGFVVDAEQAHALWQTGNVAFIDVLPRAPKPDNLPEGTIWREQPRHSIPGAIWLPNVGYGAIADVTADYFKSGLRKATSDNTDHPILFFCLAECWMSWNAAKRAVEYGHAQVYWFPEGTDGWALQDYPLEIVKPETAH